MTDLAELEARLLAWSAVHPTGCRLWTGKADPTNGYARFEIRGTRYYAHRAAHIVWKGPIPAGFEVDHLCFDRKCIAPDHLEAVTPDENKRRAMAIRAIRVVCPRGHKKNVNSSGKTYCTSCNRERYAAWRSENPVEPYIPVTQCKRGHPYDEVNTKVRVRASDGYVYRVCRVCERQRRRKVQAS